MHVCSIIERVSGREGQGSFGHVAPISRSLEEFDEDANSAGLE